jgi:TetR/AcrR family tetracycline transcriptional repressor
MARPSELPIDHDDVVDAALAILRKDGLEAVSMRSVAAKLGVSPFPLYSRVGNKEAMLDAIADRLVTDASPEPAPGEHWAHYAERWARSLRERLRSTPELGKVLGTRRRVYVGAVDPLVAALHDSGIERDDAVRAARLLLWSTVGFVIVEAGAIRTSSTSSRRKRGKAGSDPTGVSIEDADALFDQHLRYVIAGLGSELE